jgi:hypothetical protein
VGGRTVERVTVSLTLVMKEGKRAGKKTPAKVIYEAEQRKLQTCLECYSGSGDHEAIELSRPTWVWRLLFKTHHWSGGDCSSGTT